MNPHPEDVVVANSGLPRWLFRRELDAGQSSFFLTLYDTNGYRGSTRVIGLSCLIGSSPKSLIQIPDLDLADTHAVVNNIAGILTITACHEAPVAVNGKEVKGTTRLQPGDKVTLGGRLIVIVDVFYRSAVRGDETTDDKKVSGIAKVLGWISRLYSVTPLGQR
jgi:hypothetical protein